MSDKTQSERNTLEEGRNGVPPSASASVGGGSVVDDLPNMNRRSFFTRTLVGGGAAIAAGGATVGVSKASLKGRKSEGIIGDVQTKAQLDLAPYASIPTRTRDLEIGKQRIAQYQKLNKTDFAFLEENRRFDMKRFDNNVTGKTHLDRAVYLAAGAMSKHTKGGHNDYNPAGLAEWLDMSDVFEEKYQFESDQHKADAIKSAARMFGAGRVGIAKFDKRFVYDPMWEPKQDKLYYWDKDIPFEPKSVIMIAIPMDYDAIATSPSFTATASVVTTYMKLTSMYSQMAYFLRNLGYAAFGGSNGILNSVAYGILAGLGEGGRNNQLIMPGLGSRARLTKIITELDFGDAYDEPHEWGVAEFCESCMKCADSCPSEALSREVKRSFEPKYEHSDEPGYTWNNQIGAFKWYGDAKKCYQFWIENEAACANCNAACTFNEPDFWHHWLIMAVNPAMPKFVHSLMADAHPAFGYGGQGPIPIEGKVNKFWKSGHGMRTNLSNKDNQYTSGKT